MLTSLNRGMRALAVTLGRRGIGFVLALTLVVILVGAAGMSYFESPSALRAEGVTPTGQTGGGIESYWGGLWWTAMAMTTMGSAYWPQTVEGRILAFLLAVYAFTVFGYITATIASHFVRLDTENTSAPVSGAEPATAEPEAAQPEAAVEAQRQAQEALSASARETAALRREVAALREQITELSARTESATARPSEREASRR
jgi:voltage-gated potassium channel